MAALAAGSGLTRLLLRRRRRRGDHRVYVLEYHGVTAAGVEREGVVSAERFRRHLRYLGRRYRLETVAAAAELLARPGGLGEDVAAVTFDDGYADNHEVAWPELRAVGAPATIYLTTGFLDGRELWFDLARRLHERAGTRDVEAALRRLKTLEPGRRDARLAELRAELGRAAGELPPPVRAMSWDAARELAAAGVELGAHTVSHPILSTLGAAEQAAEVRGSRDRLAAELGAPPRTFAYPNGSARDFDRHSLTAVREAGFEAACTTVRGSNRPGCDPFTLRRLGVGSDSLALLETRLAGLFDQELRDLLARRRRP